MALEDRSMISQVCGSGEPRRACGVGKCPQRPVLFAKVAALGLAKKISPSRRLKAHLAVLVDTRLARLFDTVSLSDVYGLIVSKSSAELRDAFELAASAESLPLLVHCTHGKDRTGVLIAMLLHICGASRETIAAEYALSHSWGCSIEGRAAMLEALPEKFRAPIEPTDQFERWCSAPEDAIHNLWRRISRKFGSVDAYLDSIGINASTRARICAALTVPREELPTPAAA